LSDTEMFFSIAVVATAGGIVLTGLMGISLYGCTRKCHVFNVAYRYYEKVSQVDTLI